MGREVSRQEPKYLDSCRKCGNRLRKDGKGEVALHCPHLADLLTDAWRLGKASCHPPLLSLRSLHSASSLSLRGGPGRSRAPRAPSQLRLLSFLQPGGDHGAQGVSAGWGQLSVVLSPPASQRVSLDHHLSGWGTAAQADTIGASGIHQEMLTFPGPVPLVA